MHRIQRQVVEVEVQGGEEAALALQKRLVEVSRDAGAAHLEAALAIFDPGDDRVVVIDRLDVDLGIVRPEGLETALTQALSSAVTQSLREGGLAPAPAPTSRAPAYGMSRAEAVLGATLHFLRHGRLPWWFNVEEGRSLEQQFKAALAAEKDAASPDEERVARSTILEDLRRALRDDGRARARLLQQFSASTLMAVLERLDPSVHRLLWRVLRSSRIPVGGPLRHRMETSLIDTALEAATGAISAIVGAAEDDLLRAAIVRVAPRHSQERASLARIAEVGIPSDAVHLSRDPVPSPPSDEAIAKDGIPVEDAGVVLLHPFLPHLFEVLGIAERNVLLYPGRAALLLHHLTTGALAAEEHALVLAKVLCGIPVEANLLREAPVTPEEQEECTNLLESVVRHWHALGSTSADGLRGNFLVRRGRLDQRDGDWLLRVERLSHDVLLDSLPWGVAHVKLPWMPRLMRVEWTT